MGKGSKRKAADVACKGRSIKNFKARQAVLPWDTENVPLAIDYITLEPIHLNATFSDREGAVLAAKGEENHARLMGSFTVSVTEVSPFSSFYEKLISEQHISPAVETKGNPMEIHWNSDGEFKTQHGQIPISRLLDMEYENIIEYSSQDKMMIQNLLALQSPASSSWRRPFLRLVSQHEFHTHQENKHKGQILLVKYYIYFTRLIFELISDDALKHVISKITVHPSITVHKCYQRPPQQIMFHKSSTISNKSNETRFTIDHLLSYAESTGFDISCSQPKEITVELFPYQMSTYSWMLAQENLPGLGLNSYLWETWEMHDGGGNVFYFPEGGEFRLTQPPESRGGLLCEEMGLGKTVEVLALVLGNPASIANDPSDLDPNIMTSRATLIIVPSILTHQWWKELSSRVKTNTLKMMNIVNASLDGKMSSMEIPLLDIRPKCEQEDGLTNPWGSFDIENLQKDIIGGCFVEAEARLSSVSGSVVPIKILEVNLNKGTAVINFSLLKMLSNNDVVLTSYESFRRFASAYKKIKWHRIVLDECQEIKTSTSDIAHECSNLESKYRWMVSGTPFVSSINDLHGELQFLKVWPFCLPDRVDGFWKKRVSGSFASKRVYALKLLYSLIDAVMMRHSKSQSYINGEPLLQIPGRIVEWRGFDVSNISESYLYKYLENFAIKSTQHFKDVNDELDGRKYIKKPHFTLLRFCIGLLSRCLTHPDAVDLRKLDNIRRKLLPALQNLIPTPTPDEPTLVPKVTAEAALHRLQMFGAGVGGGLNRDTNRVLQNVAVSELELKLKEELSFLSIANLREQIYKEGLPMPMVWTKLNCKIQLQVGSSVAECFYLLDNKKAPKDNYFKNLDVVLKTGDTVRILHSDDLDMERKIIFVNESSEINLAPTATRTLIKIGDIHFDKPWEGYDVNFESIYKHALATRSEPYVQLLVSKMVHRQIPLVNTNVGTTIEVPEVGFETLYRLIAGRSVECPLCLSSEAVRPAVASCVHVFCLFCILDVVSKERSIAKCPCCRRPISLDSITEIVVENFSQSKDFTVITSDESSIAIENASFSSSSQSSHTVFEELVNDSSGSSTLVIPELNQYINGATDNDINVMELPHIQLLRRSPQLPSIEPLPLTHFNSWKDGTFDKSCRMNAIFQDMDAVLKANSSSKFVIFSQYPESLASLKLKLEITRTFVMPICCALILPSMNVADKQDSLRRFHEDESYNVCLILLGTGSSGLTLTVAHVCYILEPTHNAAEEAQALNRVHRIGQCRPVRCVIFFAKKTMEERLLVMRQNRRMLSELFQSNNNDSNASSSGVDYGVSFYDMIGIQQLLGMDIADDSEFERIQC